MGRKRVSEWWEVWWKKPGGEACRVTGLGGWVPDPCLHRDAFVSREEARIYVRQQKNKYLRIVHVVRYRRSSPNKSDPKRGQ